MKKILLASTMLVGTTGFAAADVTFSGSAWAGLGYNMTTGVLYPEVTAAFVAGMMTTTDQGLEVGASVMVGGPGSQMQRDPGDNEFGTETWAPGGGFVTGTSVYMSGSWGKLVVAYDTNADDSNATPGDQDITATYTNTWGNFSLAAFGVLTPVGSTATTNGDLGIKGTYNFGNYSVWAAVERDASDADGNTIDLKAGASASISGFTAAADIKYDLGNATPFSYGVSAGYATGPYAISAFFNSDIEYGAKATYDLGGGVGLEAGYAHSNGVNSAAANVVWAGVSMKF